MERNEPQIIYVLKNQIGDNLTYILFGINSKIQI